jgi:hypothetical protein
MIPGARAAPSQTSCVDEGAAVEAGDNDVERVADRAELAVASASDRTAGRARVDERSFCS